MGKKTVRCFSETLKTKDGHEFLVEIRVTPLEEAVA